MTTRLPRRLQHLAAASGLSEEIILELERIVHFELSAENIEHARGVARSMDLSIPSAARLAQRHPDLLDLLEFLFGVDRPSIAIGKAYSGSTRCDAKLCKLTP